MKKIKTLFFLNSSLIGGAERNFLDLSLYLKEEIDITLAALEPGGPLLEMAKLNGIKVFDPGFTHYLHPIYVFRTLRFLRREKFDVVFISGLKLKVVILPLTYLMAVPVRVSMILGIDLWKNRFHYFIEKITNLLTSHWIANSVAAKMRAIQFEKVDPERTSVIYNGTFFDANQQKIQKDKNCFKIAVLANIKEGKGHYYFLEVVKDLQNKIKNLSIEFIGKDETNGQIQEKIKEYGFEEVVRLAGFVKDVRPYIRNFHLMVLPSFNESFPNSIIECMLERVPVISTKVGGIPEMIRNKSTGILVDAGNRQEMYQAIIEVAENSEMLELITETAYQYAAQNFTIRTFADSYLKLIKSLTNKDL